MWRRKQIGSGGGGPGVIRNFDKQEKGEIGYTCIWLCLTLQN